jgi:hypothetical protein
MKKYQVYAMYTASKPVGEVEAENEKEAVERGWGLVDHVRLCHECARKLDVGDAYEVLIEEA